MAATFSFFSAKIILFVCVVHNFAKYWRERPALVEFFLWVRLCVFILA